MEKSSEKEYPEGGVYLLKIKLAQKSKIKVGALGEKLFPAGYYFYAGTAQRNFESRLKRHYSQQKKLHWHIDYLLKKAELEADYAFEFKKQGECFLTEILNAAGAKTIVSSFGASDCSCNSHLLYFDFKKGAKIVEKIIKNRDLKSEFSNYIKD